MSIILRIIAIIVILIAAFVIEDFLYKMPSDSIVVVILEIVIGFAALVLIGIIVKKIIGVALCNCTTVVTGKPYDVGNIEHIKAVDVMAGDYSQMAELSQND